MKGHKMKRFIILLVSIICLIYLIGCSDIFDSEKFAAPIPQGMGAFKLNVDGARTVLPVLGADVINAYKLIFTPETGDPIEEPDYTLNDTIYLMPGDYELTVIAYADTAMEKPVAYDTDEIFIIEGGSTTCTVALKAYGVVTGENGSFTWNITYPGTVTQVILELTDDDGFDETYYIKGASDDDDVTGIDELPSGYYQVKFTFIMTNYYPVEWYETLHVYQNMTSRFVYTFLSSDFNGTRYTVTFNYDDGTTPEKTQTRAYDTLAGNPGNPARDGWDFGGWYNGDQAWNFSTDKVHGDITLTAKWNDKTNVELTPDGTVNFGEIEYGDSVPAAQTITIDNTAGTNDVEITGIALTSGVAFVLNDDDEVPFVISAGSSATFNVRPVSGLNAASSAYIDTITVTYDDGKTLTKGVTFTVNKKPITAAAITVQTPSTGAAVDTDPPAGTAQFDCSAVEWFFADGDEMKPIVGTVFLGNTEYTAKVVLTAGSNYTFTDIDIENVTISGEEVTTLDIEENGDYITITYKFSATSSTQISTITVTAPPELSYTHGYTLNLSAMRVTLTYTDTTTESGITYNNFAEYGINISLVDSVDDDTSTAISHGTQLTHLTHNGKIIRVSGGSVNVHASSGTTLTLAVAQRDLSNVTASVTKSLTYNGYAQTLDNDDISVSDTVNSSNIISGTDWEIQGYSSNTNVGTAVVTIKPTATSNYTGTKEINFTIGKATLTVTARNQTINYNAAPPAYTYDIEGYLGSDTGSVVTGTAVFTSTYTQGSAPGEYLITYSSSTLSATNYDFTYVGATLTVNKAPGKLPGAITASSVTENSITVNAVTVSGNDQTIKYNISKVNNNSGFLLAEWQTGITFSGLEPNTTYYVYARSEEGANHLQGVWGNGTSTGGIRVSDAITTGGADNNDISISINFINDEAIWSWISGGTTNVERIELSLSGSPISIGVVDYIYSSINWEVNGEPKGTTRSITLNPNDFDHNDIGQIYQIYLEVRLTDKPGIFNSTIELKITE